MPQQGYKAGTGVKLLKSTNKDEGVIISSNKTNISIRLFDGRVVQSLKKDVQHIKKIRVKALQKPNPKVYIKHTEKWGEIIEFFGKNQAKVSISGEKNSATGFLYDLETKKEYHNRVNTDKGKLQGEENRKLKKKKLQKVKEEMDELALVTNSKRVWVRYPYKKWGGGYP